MKGQEMKRNLSVRARFIGSSLALCLLGSAGAVALSEMPASASSGSYMVQQETPEQTPGGSTLGEWPIPKGGSVTMECWTRGPNVDGSQKWFYVDSNVYPYPDGYVPANSVGNQSSVGLC
jgi:hypothetical protein